MLQAKTEYGNMVTLASCTKQEISAWKKQTQFFCPACLEPVIAKAGPRTIPHFAHRSKSSCPLKEGGEGSYHEKGKLLLYQWLKHQRLDVQLEAYLPDIRQRPDLLVNLKNKTIAIEYQCAKITSDEIFNRTSGYESQGIVPIWILGANRMDRRNRHKLNVDQFQLHLIHQFSSEFPLTLYFFCPETLQFILFQDLYFLARQQAIGTMLIQKINDMVLTDLFQTSFLSRTQLYQNWKWEKRQYRTRPSRPRYGRELKWQQWLYMKSVHRETLPSIVHLPVSAQYKMKTPPWDWQSRLCLDIINPLPLGDVFTLQQCMHLLRTHFLKSFPLIKSDSNPVYQYLQLLEQLQMIQETSAETFSKRQPITFYEHIEDALKGDDQLLDQFMKQNMGIFPE